MMKSEYSASWPPDYMPQGELCPACDGKGSFHKPLSRSTCPEPCEVCHGQGLIWKYTDPRGYMKEAI